MSLKIPLDLHIHSNHSDGDKSPQEILLQAQKLDLKMLALTDHDVISGTIAILKSNPTDIKIIPGVELESTEPELQKNRSYFGLWNG